MSLKILMINKYIILLVVAFSITSCLPRHTSLAYENMNSFADKMYKEKKMRMWGIGGGFLEDINEFDMNFYSNEELNLNEARKLYIYVFESFLSQINKDTRMRPYLHEYPFPIDRVSLMITFVKNGDRVCPPNIANACTRFNRADNKTYISYAIYENENYSTCHLETYDEAKRLAQNLTK